MIVFEKSHHNLINCFEVYLSSQLEIIVEPISKPNILKDYARINGSINEEVDDVRKPLLLDNTGMIHGLVWNGDGFKSRSAPLTDTDLEEYRARVCSTEYGWCMWALINPALATNDMIHVTMNYKMSPLHEKGRFSERLGNMETETIMPGFRLGNFPKIIFLGEEEKFVEEIMRTTTMTEGSIGTVLKSSIERQQQVVVPEEEFDVMRFRRSLNGVDMGVMENITRSNFDYVQLFIAQMAALTYVNIKFKDRYVKAIQEAIDSAVGRDSEVGVRAARSSSRLFASFDLDKNEERKKWEREWTGYTKYLLLSTHHFKKIAAQMGANVKKLGSFRILDEENHDGSRISDSEVLFDHQELVEFFKDMSEKPENRRERFMIFHNEVAAQSAAVIRRRAQHGVPVDIMSRNNQGKTADMIIRILYGRFDRQNSANKFKSKEGTIMWTTWMDEGRDEKLILSNNPFKATLTASERLGFQDFVAELWTNSQLSPASDITPNTTVKKLADILCKLDKSSTEDKLKEYIQELSDEYRRLGQTIVSEKATPVDQNIQNRALVYIRTILYVAIQCRIEVEGWTIDVARQTVKEATMVEKGERKKNVTKVSDLADNPDQIREGFNQAVGPTKIKLNNWTSLQEKLLTPNEVTVVDLMRLWDQNKTEPNQDPIITRIEDFVSLATPKEGGMTEHQKNLGDMVIKIFRGKYGMEDSKMYKQAEISILNKSFEGAFQTMFLFVGLKGRVSPRGKEVVNGQQTTGFNPYTITPKKIVYEEEEPPEILISMLPSKKAPVPRMLMKRKHSDLPMRKFLKIHCKVWFEHYGIENPNLKARFIYRMWDLGGDQLPVFMQWFPASHILSIDSEETYKEFVEDIIDKYDGPSGDRTEIYIELVKNAWQRKGERIEQYVERMTNYMKRAKQVQEIVKNTPEMIELTNAIVHKLSSERLRLKITESPEQVGLVQMGKLDEIVRIINDDRRGCQYIREQKKVYGSSSSSKGRYTDRDRKKRSNYQKPYNSSRKYTVNANSVEGTEKQGPEHTYDAMKNDPDMQYYNAMIGNAESETDSEAGEDEFEVNQISKNQYHQKRQNKGDRKDGYRKDRKSYKDKRRPNERRGKSRDPRRSGRDGKKQNSGQRYKRPAKKFTAKDFTRQKSYAKKVLGFRRALNDKNLNRKDGNLKAKAPAWYKGAAKNYVPPEEYFAMRNKHLPKGPIKIAKREKNQHKIDVVNQNELVEFESEFSNAYRDERNTFGLLEDDLSPDKFLKKYDIFQVSLEEGDYDEDWHEELNLESSSEEEDSGSENQSSEEYASSDEGARSRQPRIDINMNTINVINKKSTHGDFSTFFLDMLIDLNRHKENEGKNLEKAVARDISRINEGNTKVEKYCPVTALLDTGAAANLMPYELLQKCMPRMLQDVEKTKATINSANSSAINLVGEIVLDFSLVSYPLLKYKKGRGAEVRFKDIVFYVCKHVEKPILGQEIMHELNEKMGVLFSPSMGGISVPKDHMVLGLKQSMDPKTLRVVKFYRNKPSNKCTGFINTMDMPVNYLSEKSPKTSSVDYASIFTVDRVKPVEKEVNTNKFKVYGLDTEYFQPGETKKIRIAHDNNKSINSNYEFISLNEHLDVCVLSRDSAKVSNNKASPFVLKGNRPIGLLFDTKSDKQETINEIYLDLNNRNCDAELQDTIEIVGAERNYDINTFEINQVDIDFVNSLEKGSEGTHDFNKMKKVDSIKKESMVGAKNNGTNTNSKHLDNSKEDYMKQKFEDPTRKFEGVERYGHYCQTHKDPQWVPDKKSKMKWSEKGLTKQHREKLGLTSAPREHPMLTMDKDISRNPPKVYKNIYFPPGVMSKSKNGGQAHQIDN